MGRARSRRAFLRLTAGLGFLWACAPTAPTTAPPAEPASAVPAARTSRVLWSNWAVDAGSLARLAEQERTFEAAHISIDLELQNTPSAEYMTRLLASFAADQAPDVIRLNTEQLPIFVSRDQIVDLDPLAKSMPSAWLARTDIKPGLVERFRLGKGLSALPYGGDMDALYVNRSLFKDVGEEPPPADYTDPSWTYARALALAQKLTRRRDGIAQSLGIDIGGYRYEGHVENAGGSWFTADGTKFAGHEGGAVAAIDWLASLLLKHRVAAVPATDEARSFAFATGKLAMSWSGVSQVSNRLADVGERFEWDVYPVPRWGTNPRVVKSGFSALTLGTRSKERDAAWQLLHFITGPVGSLPDVETGWSLPVFTSLDSRYFSRVGTTKNLRVALDGPAYPSKFPMWTNKNYAEAWRAVQRAIDVVFQGKETAGDALGSIRTQVDELLARS